MVFLEVAGNEGITAATLMKKLGTKPSPLNRYLLELQGRTMWDRKEGREVEMGLGLIKSQPDLYEPRALAYTLTPKGREVVNKLTGV
jgi:DNA-binding MarR family transcriptional regulator